MTMNGIMAVILCYYTEGVVLHFKVNYVKLV